MDNKIFKNLDEQVEILKQKNLTINDVNYAKLSPILSNFSTVSDSILVVTFT